MGQIIPIYLYSWGPPSPLHQLALVLPSYTLATVAELLWTVGSKEEKQTIISV